MEKGFVTKLPRPKIGMVALALVLMGSAPAVSIATEESDLLAEVDRITLACQEAESLPVERLQDVLVRCDTLTAAVSQSSHPRKKLLLIRVKQSCNLCRYLLELRQPQRLPTD